MTLAIRQERPPPAKGDAAMSFTTEARFSSPAGMVEIRNYHWPTPLDDVLGADAAVFGLSLSRVPDGSVARFHGEGGGPDFRPVGRMLFRPAGSEMRCRNGGGRQRLLMCSVPQGETNEGMLPCIAHLPPALDIREPALARTMHRIAQEALTPGFAAPALIEALIATLLVDFTRSQRTQPPRQTGARGGLAPWQIRRIEETVRETDGPPPSVSALARLVGISPRHLLRAFRTSMGSSVLSHIAQIRLDRACALLSARATPIKQVAGLCGFASTSAFSAAFRRKTGMTPRDFQRRAGCSSPIRDIMADPED